MTHYLPPDGGTPQRPLRPRRTRKRALSQHDLWPIIAPHAGHRIVLEAFGAVGMVTCIVLLCETCDEQLADVVIETGAPSP